MDSGETTHESRSVSILAIFMYSLPFTD